MPSIVDSKVNVQIIACQVTELDAMVPMAEQYYREDHLQFDPTRFKGALKSALELERGSAWWLCSAGERVGYALLMDGWSIEYGGLITTLDEIYVVPEWREKGVASQSIVALREQFLARGGVSMNLETTPDNFRAQDLYRRLGFGDTHRPIFRFVLSQA